MKKAGKNQQILKPHLFPIVTIENEDNFYGDSLKYKQDLLNLSSIISVHQEQHDDHHNNNNNNIKTIKPDSARTTSPKHNEVAKKRGYEKPKRPASAPKHRWVYYVENPDNEYKDTTATFPSPLTAPISLSSRARPSSPPSSHRRKDRIKSLRTSPQPEDHPNQILFEQNDQEQDKTNPSVPLDVRMTAVHDVVTRMKEPETLEEHFEKMKLEYQQNLALGKSSLAMEIIGMLQEEDHDNDNDKDDEGDDPPVSSRTIPSTADIYPPAQLVDKGKDVLPKMTKVGKPSLAKRGRLKLSQAPNTTVIPLPMTNTLFPPYHIPATATTTCNSAINTPRNPLIPSNVMLLAEEVLKKYHHNEDGVIDATMLAQPPMTKKKYNVPVSVLAPTIVPSDSAAVDSQYHDGTLLPADLSHAVQRQLARHQLLYPPNSRPTTATATATAVNTSSSPEDDNVIPAAVVQTIVSSSSSIRSSINLSSPTSTKQVRFSMDLTNTNTDSDNNNMNNAIKKSLEIATAASSSSSSAPEPLLPSPSLPSSPSPSPAQSPMKLQSINWKSFVNHKLPLSPSAPSSTYNNNTISNTTKIFRTPAILCDNNTNNAEKEEEGDISDDFLLPSPTTLTPSPPLHYPPPRTTTSNVNNLPSDEVRLNRYIHSPRIDAVYATLPGGIATSQPTTNNNNTNSNSNNNGNSNSNALGVSISTQAMKPQPRSPSLTSHTLLTHHNNNYNHHNHTHTNNNPYDHLQMEGRKSPPDSARSRLSTIQVDLRVPTPNRPAPPAAPL